jgi:hypothetical protein
MDETGSLEEPTSFAQLGRDLGINTDFDSAAILASLLNRYRGKDNNGHKNGHQYLSSILGENVSSSDLVCHMALASARIWVAASSCRAEALTQHDKLLLQLEEWTSAYVSPEQEPLFPYVAGLQLLLCLCMTSPGCAEAVLKGDIGKGLTDVLARAQDRWCPTLAAAILAVSVMQHPCAPEVQRVSEAALQAASEYLERQAKQVGEGEEINGDAVYMVNTLVQFALRARPTHGALEEIVASLLQLWEGLADCGHLLAISMVLTVLTPAAQASTAVKRQVLESGALGKLVDLLSSLSLSKSEAGAGHAGSIDQLCAGQEQQVEFILAALRFLEVLVESSWLEGAVALLSYYPSIIFRQLLESERCIVVASTCSFVARLSDGNPAAQQYCRLEEVLSKVDSVLSRNAAALLTPRSEAPLQAMCDVVSMSARALCALVLGCPENHVFLATSKGTKRIVKALGDIAHFSDNYLAEDVQVMTAISNVAGLCNALCKNITNRRIVAVGESLDVIVDAIVACHRCSGAEEYRADAIDAMDTLMHVLVTLVTTESNVARHLVERDGFMPLLFTLLKVSPVPPYLDSVTALLLVLIRDCKINKPMLIKVGVPAMVETLRLHPSGSVSPTTVQALSGVLMLLAMSKTMLDVVLQVGGLPLIIELLQYEARNDAAGKSEETLDVVASIHEAACVLISCLCDLSSKARSEVAKAPELASALLKKVFAVPEAEICAFAERQREPDGGSLALASADSAGDPQSKAIVSALGQLMQTSGPDNYVFKAAMQAMQSVQRQQTAQMPDIADDNHSRRRSMLGDSGQEDKTLILDELGEPVRRQTRNATSPSPITDAKFQLTLAAINTLFQVLHTIPEKSKEVWVLGGSKLVKHIILLASHCTESFEEAVTKLLVVFFSHRHVQESAREVGLIEHMIGLIDVPNKTTVLIATKALAVVCRNSPANQKLAIEGRLLDKCITLLSMDLDAYTAKWVILVMNALVYENAAAQQIMLEQGAVPMMVQWLAVGPEQEVATAAARALAKAAKGNAGIQQAVCDSNGVMSLVRMLRGAPGSLAVRAAAEALSDLAKDNPAGQDSIRQAGAVEQLLQMLSVSVESSSLIVTIVKVLSVLAHGNDANMELMFHAGAVPVLLDMLQKRYGHVCNAAAADLIRVLCSSRLCQQQLLRYQGLSALLATLQGSEHPAAQSAAVWAINALVQGQKSILPELLKPGTSDTLLRCIETHNGAAPGTVRLLLVVFLHSGKHEDLRCLLLNSPSVLEALVNMLRNGPALEPTKWTASLLSTLCWQEAEMKQRMLDLEAPQALADVLEMTVKMLGQNPGPETKRMITEATVSVLQALISLVDESSPRNAPSPVATVTSKHLQRLALQASCLPLVGRVCSLCMDTIYTVQALRQDEGDVAGQLQKLLKPVLRSLDWLLPLVNAPPPEVQVALQAIESCQDAPAGARKHAASLLAKHRNDHSAA